MKGTSFEFTPLGSRLVAPLSSPHTTGAPCLGLALVPSLWAHACPSASSPHLDPTRPRRAPSSSNSFAQKGAVSEPFSIAFPQAILSAPSRISSAAAPTPVASALQFRRRPSFRCCPRPGPRPQGRLAPQATPLSPWIAGRAGEEAAREGRAVAGGACPPRSWAAIGWTAERGRDCCLCLGAPGSSPGILRSSTSGSGDFDAGVATLVQAACLTSGQQWTPKLGGFLTPSRVSPVPLARPGGVARRPLHLLSGRAPAQRPQECLRGSIAE